MTVEQPRNLGGGEITPGQPPQVKGGADTTDYVQKRIRAELMNIGLIPIWSKLRGLRTKFGDHIIEIAKEYLGSLNIGDPDRKSLEEELANLISFLNEVSANPEEIRATEGLEIMIKIAFEYIQRLGINDNRSQLLTNFVVEIAEEFREFVRKIAFKKQFLYETKADFLNELMSLIVELILNVDPKFRGRKPEISEFDHPNNALLTALDLAASVLLGEAAADPQKLIGAVSSLLEMTKELRSDERKLIYDGIRQKISAVMATRNIDDNLREQFDEIINQLVDQYQ